MKKLQTATTYAEMLALLPGGLNFDPFYHTSIYRLACLVQMQLDNYDDGEDSDVVGRVRAARAYARRAFLLEPDAPEQDNA